MFSFVFFVFLFFFPSGPFFEKAIKGRGESVVKGGNASFSLGKNKGGSSKRADYDPLSHKAKAN